MVIYEVLFGKYPPCDDLVLLLLLFVILGVGGGFHY